VIVCDGSDAAARRIERVLWNDPASGVMRHADAGYEEAVACAHRAEPEPADAHPMSEIFIDYLNHADVQALAMSDAEIVAAVEQGLFAQGRGETTIEPRSSWRR